MVNNVLNKGDSSIKKNLTRLQSSCVCIKIIRFDILIANCVNKKWIKMSDQSFEVDIYF